MRRQFAGRIQNHAASPDPSRFVNLVADRPFRIKSKPEQMADRHASCSQVATAIPSPVSPVASAPGAVLASCDRDPESVAGNQIISHPTLNYHKPAGRRYV